MVPDSMHASDDYEVLSSRNCGTANDMSTIDGTTIHLTLRTFEVSIKPYKPPKGPLDQRVGIPMS